MFFRANAPLKTNEADLATLAGLGITHSYDMRAQDEIDNPGQTVHAASPLPQEIAELITKLEA